MLSCYQSMKKVLIAGASSGIGHSIAEKLLAAGHEVISVSRNSPNLNVTEHLSYDMRTADKLPAVQGALDGLIYCPGSITLKPFKSLKVQDFLADFEINLLGAVKLIQAYLPNLQLSGTASIILFSSVAAGTGMNYHSSIAASKGAVEGLVKSLAAEFAPAIRVNAIAPSLVKTPMTVRLTDTDAKISQSAERHPLKRIGAPAEIASLAVYLLGDDASWISGQIMHIDGGMSSLKS